MSSHPLYERARQRLLADLAARQIDAPVLGAIGQVRREDFVPPWIADQAYTDQPLPIGEGQTISQPYVVAWMAQAARLSLSDRVLEIGSGSGYGAAVLSRLAQQVVTVERLPGLAERARQALARGGFDNVEVYEGDGTGGWAAGAPYDAVVVTAAGPRVPEPLLRQLAPHGRLICPVGTREGEQILVRVERKRGELDFENLGAVRFVPLIGQGGFAER